MQAAAAALLLHRFTRYHQRWLADCVQTEEEESCKQWLLYQSPEVATVREAEEYRPGRVRYRYTTEVGLPAKVQSEWACAIHVARLSTMCSLASTTANYFMKVPCVVVPVPRLLTISS